MGDVLRGGVMHYHTWPDLKGVSCKVCHPCYCGKVIYAHEPYCTGKPTADADKAK